MKGNGNPVVIRGWRERKKALELKKRRQAPWPPKRPKNGKVRVGHLLDLVVADYELHGRSNLDLARHHARLLDGCIGTMKAEDVNYQTGTALAQRWRAQGMSPATVNRRLSCLRKGFSLGEMSGLVDRIPKLPKLVEDNVRQGFVEPYDFQRILDALDDPDIRDLIEWLGLTGMRVGEATYLEWCHVHRVGDDGLELRIPARITKNRRGRVLPLVGPLRVVIDRRLKTRRNDMPWIFRRTDDPDRRDTSMRIRFFQHRWNKAVKEIGKPDLMIHDLRRSAIRNLRLAGIPEDVAMKISGHRTRAVFERYNIVTNSDLAAAVMSIPTPQPPW